MSPSNSATDDGQWRTTETGACATVERIRTGSGVSCDANHPQSWRPLWSTKLCSKLVDCSSCCSSLLSQLHVERSVQRRAQHQFATRSDNTSQLGAPECSGYRICVSVPARVFSYPPSAPAGRAPDHALLPTHVYAWADRYRVAARRPRPHYT